MGTQGGTGAAAWIAPLVVLLAALAFALPQAGGSLRWTPDGLFYEAQARELMGTPPGAARAAVWTGPAAAELRGDDFERPLGERRYTDPEWVEYSAQFYRRRWVVPALAAAIHPVAHERSLTIVSLAGYVLFGLLLYVLLRRGFSRATSAGVTVAFLALDPVRHHSFWPGTDSFALALECAALLAAALALERGLRWVVPWALAVLLLALTRDATLVPLFAVAWIGLRERTRIATWLLGSGLVAALPLIVFGAPLTALIHYEAADFSIPSGGESLPGDYAELAGGWARGDASYVVHHPFTALVIVAVAASAVMLLVRRPPASSLLRLLPGAALGAAVTILLNPASSGLRLELIAVPVAAIALAAGVEELAGAVRANRVGAGAVGAR